jgi:hypothetical protein
LTEVLAALDLADVKIIQAAFAILDDETPSMFSREPKGASADMPSSTLKFKASEISRTSLVSHRRRRHIASVYRTSGLPS